LFLRRNDTALVESPTFLGALDAFGALGASIGSSARRAGGVRLDVLRDAVRQRPARLLYLTPTFTTRRAARCPKAPAARSRASASRRTCR
jgi:DNA-binding transcriptional MocR family regulator